MKTKKELTDAFFCDLKKFNGSNFKTLAKADLSKQDPVVHKAFSSVLTRYFIFKEKHPEIKEEEFRLLYFVLSLDLVAQYFAEYPDAEPKSLIAFQLHLNNYIKESKQRHNSNEEEGVSDERNSEVSDIELVTDNGVPVEQQQESVSVAS